MRKNFIHTKKDSVGIIDIMITMREIYIYIIHTLHIKINVLVWITVAYVLFPIFQIFF